MLYMSAVEGIILSVAVSVAGHASALCVHISMCLWDIQSASLPVEPAHKKTAATSISLGQTHPRSLGTLERIPVASKEEFPGPELLEVTAT